MVSVPPWFYSLDLFFDSFSVLAGLIIVFLSLKIYRLTKEFRFRDLSVAFFLISLGFLLRILGNFAQLYKPKVIQIVSTTIPSLVEAVRPRTLYNTGIFLYDFFILFGLSLLFLINIDMLGRRRVFIPFFLILSIILASFSYNRPIIFHLVSALYLFYIVNSYYSNWQSKKTRSSFFVFTSFVLFLISQIVFIFTTSGSSLWLLGEIIYLSSFILLLLILLIIILRKPKGVQNVRGKKN